VEVAGGHLRVEERERLRDALHRLVEGGLTNDEFDDEYCRAWVKCPDRAVAEIATFGWSLYSSDVGPYCLKGWHTVDSETRQIAERCILFLGSEFVYGWPETPKQDLQSLATGVALCLGTLLGVALAFVALFCLALPSLSPFLCTAILAAIVLGVSLLLYRWGDRRAGARSEAFYSAGCREAWPFLRQEEYRRTVVNAGSEYAGQSEAPVGTDRPGD
jgi:hypothetical protein